MKAQPLPDNSPEGQLRRARIFGVKQWAAIRKIADETNNRREAEIAAMSPEERIAARLVEHREADVYEDVYPFIMEAGDAWEEKMKDPAFVRRLEQACDQGRRRRTMELLADETRLAGAQGRTAPTGRMSKPLTKKEVQALVVKRYANHRKTNQSEWWKRYIVEAGVIARKAHYRGYSVDLGQLAASLSKLTEDDIAPYLA